MGSIKCKTNHTVLLERFHFKSFETVWFYLQNILNSDWFDSSRNPQESSDIGRRNAKKMWKTLSVGNNSDLHWRDESESYGFTIIKELPASGCQGLVAITEISFLLIAGNFTANVDLIVHFCFVFFYTSNGPCTKKTKNNDS